ncbi:MAG: hypothetical protein BGO10_03075 [Chlamydia sp. 32-24]|nr:MAG: hypothetical protein BGO10_03075 [Chlamydia sp. 32-24]
MSLIKNQVYQRIISGVIAALFFSISIYFAMTPFLNLLFFILLLLVTVAASKEYYELLKAKGIQPLTTIGLFGAGLITTTFYISAFNSTYIYLPLFSFFLLFLFSFVYLFQDNTQPLIRLSTTFFSYIYIVIPFCVVFNILYFFPANSKQDSRWWIVYTLITTKAMDIGGYIVGKSFGKNLLIPSISPKKTWEGLIGGVFFTILCSVFLIFLLSLVYKQTPLDLSFTWGIILGLILAILSILGDLSESLLKRDANVKDSGFLPGLGGFLDMVDSLIFTIPFMYFFLLYYFQNG